MGARLIGTFPRECISAAANRARGFPDRFESRGIPKELEMGDCLAFDSLWRGLRDADRLFCRFAPARDRRSGNGSFAARGGGAFRDRSEFGSAVAAMLE